MPSLNDSEVSFLYQSCHFSSNIFKETGSGVGWIVLASVVGYFPVKCLCLGSESPEDFDDVW